VQNKNTCLRVTMLTLIRKGAMRRWWGTRSEGLEVKIKPDAIQGYTATRKWTSLKSSGV
jgi:hypothetical protein